MIRSIRIAVMALSVCAGQAMGQSVAEHLELGTKEEAAFRPEAALRHYEAALEIEPANVAALDRASKVAVDAGEIETDKAKRKAFFARGEALARRAVAADSNDAEAHFHLARALGMTALSVGARERVRYATDIRAHALESLRLDPKHPGALHVMGVWNAEVMRLNGVTRFFAKNVLGGKVFATASWKDAVSYMEQAVEVDPMRLTHRLDLAEIYLNVGDKTKAREQFERVVNGAEMELNDATYKRKAAAALASMK